MAGTVAPLTLSQACFHVSPPLSPAPACPSPQIRGSRLRRTWIFPQHPIFPPRTCTPSGWWAMLPHATSSKTLSSASLTPDNRPSPPPLSTRPRTAACGFQRLRVTCWMEVFQDAAAPPVEAARLTWVEVQAGLAPRIAGGATPANTAARCSRTVAT